jgi:hypothetical protein
MCKGNTSPPVPRVRAGSINSPLIRKLTDSDAIKNEAATLLKKLEDLNDPNVTDTLKKPYINRAVAIKSSGPEPAYVYTNGFCMGIVTYREANGYVYIRDFVGMPNCRGIGRSLLVKLRQDYPGQPIKLSPMDNSEPIFKRLGFVAEGGFYELAADRPIA